MIRKFVMKNAKQSVFLFEKEKLGKKYLYKLCDKNEAFDVIIAE